MSVVVPALVWLFRRSKLAAYEAMFKMGVELAYKVVNDAAARSENKIDDKAALALKVLRDYLSSQGQALKANDEVRAKLLWSAMHSEDL